MDSPCESESSLDGGAMLPPSPVSREQLQKRIESLTQQNKVLKVELETYKIRVKVIQEENRSLRQASVIIQAKAEQEEEYISNTLLKKIQALKKEKETLAHHYEREEECLTNDLSRKLDQLRQEKCKLELTLEQEQECLVNKLMRKIEKLEAETSAKQNHLEQLRREMVELENTLEQEQEALVNKLWKRMDKLEAEKRSLQIKLDQPVSDPTSPKEINHRNENGSDTASQLTAHIQNLRSEVDQLRGNLAAAEKESKEKSQQFAQEEKCIRDENKRLQRKLQQEVERREALSRHLSESESSLEFEEERLFNESVSAFGGAGSSSNRPLSPGALTRCHACGQLVTRRTSERFIKPAIPLGLNTSAPNVLHHHNSMGGHCHPGAGSGSGHFPMLSTSAGTGGGGGGANTSLNSSVSSSSTYNTSSNISFSGNSSFVQPASPMDTSMCKD
ncbi:coiled-coil domain-containing protein 6 [Topomyia yanbarensis]|uniref:coiled-coil domain-containing protein 6 n=1 Tax=Topomyia yanbarensis TaxID=2498891 RepID=UPI00273CBBFF|nr:coiled-coil domain-containing protein 6 [Topomyia yanbarensis]